MELASPSPSTSNTGVAAVILNDTVPGTPCSGNSSAFAALNGGVGQSDFVFFTTNTPGNNSGTRQSNAAGTEFTFSKNDSRLANYGYKCVTVDLKELGVKVDSLDQPLYFLGYGPDSDGDGVVDNIDECPNQSGPAPTGCPAPVVVPPVDTTPVVTTPVVTTPVKTTPTKTTPTKTPVKSSTPAKCRKLSGAKKKSCIKREKALTKCKKLKGKRKTACIKKAKKIK